MCPNGNGVAIQLEYAAYLSGQKTGLTHVTQIRLQTTYGAVLIELDNERAPETVSNFLKYVNDGFFDGTIFHRVMDNFMIQGGGFLPGMVQKATRPPIKNEASNGLRNARGTIAMARTSDPHSATAQFFLNVTDNDFLNYTSESPNGWGYCVFGRVIDGMTVVDRIKGVPTTVRAGHKDVPITEVLIENITVLEP